MKAFRERVPGTNFEVTWHPFFLDSTLPVEGVNRLEMYKAKFGEARIAQMLPYMARVGAEENIRFSWGGKTANTTTAHRLATLALKEGGPATQDKVIEGLFHAYFEADQSVGDKAVLENVAVAAGMDRSKVAALLADEDEGRNEVIREVKTWQNRYRISGVPYFVIGNKYRLSGAQDPGAFMDAFEEIVEHEKEQQQEAGGAGGAVGAGGVGNKA